jgi:hypothetical protein
MEGNTLSTYRGDRFLEWMKQGRMKYMCYVQYIFLYATRFQGTETHAMSTFPEL